GHRGQPRADRSEVVASEEVARRDTQQLVLLPPPERLEVFIAVERRHAVEAGHLIDRARVAHAEPGQRPAGSDHPPDRGEQRDVSQGAAVCAFGEIQGVCRKGILPNCAVFGEQRCFAPSTGEPQLFVIGGVRVGVSICEDAWGPTGPVADQAAGGAELVVNINASAYYAGRLNERERMLATRAADASCALLYVNQVGGQDELVFDGASLLFVADGVLLQRAG